MLTIETLHLQLILFQMAVHKLEFDDFDEIDYQLIAIHTWLEDYRLAYFVNQNLGIHLSKNKNDILIRSKEGEVEFSRFSYFNEEKEVAWDLIQNKKELVRQQKNNQKDLFFDISNEVSTIVCFLPEFKAVDYFLKIENIDNSEITEIQKTLNIIPQITTIYKVDEAKIKAKNNLIF